MGCGASSSATPPTSSIKDLCHSDLKWAEQDWEQGEDELESMWLRRQSDPGAAARLQREQLLQSAEAIAPESAARAPSVVPRRRVTSFSAGSEMASPDRLRRLRSQPHEAREIHAHVEAADAADAAMASAFASADLEGSGALHLHRAFKAVKQLGIECDVDDLLDLIRRPPIEGEPQARRSSDPDAEPTSRLSDRHTPPCPPRCMPQHTSRLRFVTRRAPPP